MKCAVCGKEHDENELIHGSSLRPAIEKLIQEEIPDWNDESVICREDLKKFKVKYFTHLLKNEKENVYGAKKHVINSLANNQMITRNVNDESQEKLTFGQKVADRVAKFGGSWKFIIIFSFIIVIWIGINVSLLIIRPFDPYPFILLNLILSCLSALQAPIIMMSQNRQAVKDRLQAENDYKVNLKSEIEIKELNEKLDHLMYDQWEKMMKVHRTQVRILREMKQIKEEEEATKES